MQRDKYLSVTALSQYIKRKFDVDPYLGKVFLIGEISNFRMRSNAHQYFSIKDDQAKISAIMFKTSFSKLKFIPEEGMKVLVTGRISVYEPSGTYQIYVESMEPDGVGALYQAYEQLKNQLKEQGVFDLPKKALPKFPKRIAVITSESGAVIRDIITTTMRRFPIAQIVLYPALVQGDRAADDIARQIKRVNKDSDFDVLIIGRGGGSIEDLWPFNEEIVARGIIDSKIPVISSVGHETDTTIADLVADMRAATPTAAAELATPDLAQLMIQINDYKNRVFTNLKNQINLLENEIQKLKSRPVMQHPERLYDIYLQRLDQLYSQLTTNMEQSLRNYNSKLELKRQKLLHNNPEVIVKENYAKLNLLNEKLISNINVIYVNKNNHFKNTINKLDSFSPLKTLLRGYSIVTNNDDEILNKISDFNVQDKIKIRISDGEINATVDEVNKNGK
ncbi:exodeoxyribonuclease VII large subunit [Companilactobacillus sp. DQM5]|uniref:exodeoxyribonuclease VII large subunit n=1 Tax=Companilactobacillus sp. DQM5 TaxID=3463359 RepID=UPI004058EE70